MKLIIGNRNYSSWSLRGWLALRQSGLSFEALTVHIDGDDWQAMKKQDDDFQPSAGNGSDIHDAKTPDCFEVNASHESCANDGCT